MKIVNTTKLMVLTKKETQGVKDPNKTYYALVVMQDDDAGSISCPKEVYDAVKEGEVNAFVTEFNQQYESFRITNIVAPTVEGAKRANS